MVNKQLTNKHMPKKVKPSVAPIGMMGGEPLVLPNHSGDNIKGFVSKTPIKDIDFANKKYVDDEITAIPADTGKLDIDGGNANQDINIGAYDFACTDLNCAGLAYVTNLASAYLEVSSTGVGVAGYDAQIVAKSLRGDVKFRFIADRNGGGVFLQSGNHAFDGNKPLTFSGYFGNTGSDLEFNFNKAKFNKTTEINAMYRELLESGEAESRSLNNANNANRTRMRAIDRRLASFTSPLPIEE